MTALLYTAGLFLSQTYKFCSLAFVRVEKPYSVLIQGASLKLYEVLPNCMALRRTIWANPAAKFVNSF